LISINGRGGNIMKKTNCKRRISLMLAVVMAFSLFTSTAYSSSKDTTLNFDLSCDGEHSITVPTGTTVEVVYTLENTSADSAYDISSIQNEIYWDTNFFDLDGIEPIYTSTGEDHVYSTGEHRVYFAQITAKEYEPSQVIGIMKFTVTETEIGAQSTIKSKQNKAYGTDYEAFNVTSEDLTVIVGDGSMPSAISDWDDDLDDVPSSTKYTVTFDTKGGTAINPITVNKGTTITLSDYSTTRSGYTFAGWYSDAELNNAVTTLTPTANTTVYAAWLAASSSSGGGGGGGGGGSSSVTTTTTTEATTETTTVSKTTSTSDTSSSDEDAVLNFVTNGGTDVNSVTIGVGTAFDLSSYVTTRIGYSFGGWYSDESCETEVTSGIVSSDMTLYASWNRNTVPTSLNSEEHFAYVTGYPDDTVRPGADITRAEVAMIFYRLLNDDIKAESETDSNKFDDVNSGDWFNTAVSTMAEICIIYGRTDTEFAPNSPITRAEFAAICARFDDQSSVGNITFTDLDGHWSENEVKSAANRGWVSGYEDGTFRPNKNITRAEAMSLINRVLERLPESNSDLTDDMIEWQDNSDNTVWYYIAVQEATNGHTYERKSDEVHEKWLSIK
jgi:uncharacterized repeat protein (TIGR02543 family)